MRFLFGCSRKGRSWPRILNSHAMKRALRWTCPRAKISRKVSFILLWRGEKVIKQPADGVAELVEPNSQQRCHQRNFHHLLGAQRNQAQGRGWRGFAQVGREDGFARGRRGFLLDLHQLGRLTLRLHVDGAGSGSRASLFFGNWRSGFWARGAFAQFWFRSRRQYGSNRVRVHWRSV